MPSKKLCLWPETNQTVVFFFSIYKHKFFAKTTLKLWGSLETWRLTFCTLVFWVNIWGCFLYLFVFLFFWAWDEFFTIATIDLWVVGKILNLSSVRFARSTMIKSSRWIHSCKKRYPSGIQPRFHQWSSGVRSLPPGLISPHFQQFLELSTEKDIETNREYNLSLANLIAFWMTLLFVSS